MKNKKQIPPRFATMLLKWMSISFHRFNALSDLEEIYFQILESEGKHKAGKWYWKQVIKSIPHFLNNTFYWGAVMLKNYLKVTLRNIKKYKAFSFINVFGLSVGMACAVLILLWAHTELTFNSFHKNAKRIYLVNRTFYNSDGSESLRLRAVAPVAGPLLKKDFPEVLEEARVRGRSQVVGYNNKYFVERNFDYAEESILKILSFDVLKGDKETMLHNPYTVVITDEIANKYFRNEDPIGKNLTIEFSGQEVNLSVTGVIKAFPNRSSWRPDFVASFSTFANLMGEDELNDWSSNNYQTFLLLPENYNPAELQNKFGDFLTRYLGENATDWTSLELQNILDYHLDNDYQGIYVSIILSIFILLIAIINFINLSTARAGLRVKEISVRKVIGADRKRVIYQFIGESVFLSLLAVLFSTIIVKICLPYFNELFMSHLTFDLTSEPALTAFLIGMGIFVGILAGIYPAIYLSKFSPVETIKNTKSNSEGKYSLRKVLVVSQFTIAIFLIIAVMIINSQMDYLFNKDLGYNKNNVVLLQGNNYIENNIERIKNELKQYPSILSVTAAKRVPSGRLADFQGGSLVVDGEKEKPLDFDLSYLRIDEDYFKTFNLELSAGREFSKEFPTDYENSFILNECAVKKLGWNSPQDALGKQMKYGGKMGNIIGVVKDFHFESLHEEIRPIIMEFSKYGSQIAIKISGKDIPSTLSFLKSKWKEYWPTYPFDYDFLEARIANRYIIEQILQKIVTYSVVLTILVACLGLLGLISFITSQKSKEIGIRKVLGASIGSLVLIVSKELSLSILISNIIAWPIAYYVLSGWLQLYPYRTEISFSFFIIAGLLAVVIAAITVGFQSIKAALKNPVESLKYE